MKFTIKDIFYYVKNNNPKIMGNMNFVGFNYTTWQQNLMNDLSIEQISQMAMEYRKER